MPRDASGNYTLPVGNPVVGGTTIEPAWANPTYADIAQGLTDSLDRDGNGGMNAALQYFDGSLAAPGITWANESPSGFRRAAQFDMRSVIGAKDVTRHLKATEAVGLQHPFELWNGLTFSPVLMGIGGTKEQPTFDAFECNDLTVDGDLNWTAGLVDGPKTINGAELFAWGHVSAAGALNSGRNVASAVRTGTGVYRITLSGVSFPNAFGEGTVLLGINGSTTAWAEWNTINTTNFDVITGTSQSINADVAFSFFVMVNYTL